jgi:CheY-like chemotaxis protein/HPt (histidine-containing phosphotransfer) domain-containing protein
MGGSISVKSKKNVGTTIFFIIEFPVGKASDLPNKDLFVADEGMLANKKILVVDDNDMNRLVATTILSSYGGITYEAANGKEALDFLLSNKVDIVLMDLQMPVMNGLDATISIRQSISTTLPIIALTANAIKGDRDKCMEVGMDDYVTKPFKEEDLMKIVTSRLNINSQINNNNMESEINPGVNYYDISDIRTISRGNEDFVKKMLKMFVEQTPGYLIEMREKFEARELGKLGEIAHKIKPTIDSMGIKSLKGTIRDIEKIAKTGIYEDVLVDLMKQVETDMNHAINAIKNDYQLT